MATLLHNEQKKHKTVSMAIQYPTRHADSGSQETKSLNKLFI